MSKDNHKKGRKGKHGYFRIRVFRHKAKGKRLPKVVCKCGCCDEKVEIYYDDESLEINGVNGSIEDWRKVFLPLLKVKKK